MTSVTLWKSPCSSRTGAGVDYIGNSTQVKATAGLGLLIDELVTEQLNKKVSWLKGARKKLTYTEDEDSIPSIDTINEGVLQDLPAVSVNIPQGVSVNNNVEASVIINNDREIEKISRQEKSLLEIDTDVVELDLPVDFTAIEVPLTFVMGAEELILNSEDESYVPKTSTPESEDRSRKRKRESCTNESAARKRSRNPLLWKVNVAKTVRNTGQEYLDFQKKVKPARVMGAACRDECRLKCSSQITETQRQGIFTDFWNIGDHSRQWDYIARCLTIYDKLSCSDPDLPSRRNVSKKYFFRVNGTQVRVCKPMFLQTLGISDSWINTVTMKMGKGAKLSPDKRGKHENRGTKLSDKLVQSVIEHINLFERKEAHYVRKDSKKEYLEEGLSVRKMHSLYSDWMKEFHSDYKICATERQYRDISNTKFNIGFHVPKKDQCDSCTTWRIANDEEKEKLRQSHDIHAANKVRSRELKNHDAQESKKRENSHISTACFDMQKALNVPKGESSVFYYKRKLSMYNFTIYDVGRGDGYCYVWREDIGNKGSNEIASFLLNYIEKMSREGVTDFRFYSDNCGGQNKNRFVFAMLLYAAAKFKVHIVHRSLECGHTQNEGDSMHSIIERKSENQNIYVPEQWLTVMSMARANKPYTVIDVEQNLIFDFKALVEKVNMATNTSDINVPWSKVREVRADGDRPGLLFYKVSFDDEASTVNIHRRVGHPLNLATHRLKNAYTANLGIPEVTLKDLLSLCNPLKAQIPSNHHLFYRSLTVRQKSNGKNAREAADKP